MTAVTDLASRGSSWGGPIVAAVAAVVFVVFSAWIVVLRLRNRKDSDG